MPVPQSLRAELADQAEPRHVPVLADACLALLKPAPGRRFLDCTLGLGGHSEALLAYGASVVGIDRDAQARALATARLAPSAQRLEIRAGDYAREVEACVPRGERFHGVLADIGVSSLQLDDPERGFGLRSSAHLDLRMDPSQGVAAWELIAQLGEGELADILYQYGEERLSRRIAPALQRAVAEGKTSGVELAETIRAVVRGHQKRHPALRSFQALRIAVNDELGQLERLLVALPQVLHPGGTAVLISFHSLEDRAIKQSFRVGQQAGVYAAISRRVLTASPDELNRNPRAHSAKLRWAQTQGDA